MDTLLEKAIEKMKADWLKRKHLEREELDFMSVRVETSTDKQGVVSYFLMFNADGHLVCSDNGYKKRFFNLKGDEITLIESE